MNNNYPNSLFKCCLCAVFISPVFASVCYAQAVTARAITGTNVISISVPTNQRIEFLSLEPAPTYGFVDVSTLMQGSGTNTTLNPGPAWSIVYSNPTLTLSSDTRKTNVMSSSFAPSATTNVYVTRKTLPEFIVGPATFRITPQSGASFMLNYRLRTNN